MSLSNSVPLSILQPGVCTSSTRPTNPYLGQTIYETDTNKTLVWHGATIGWNPPWNTPWGVQGYAQSTTTFGPVTTTVAITSMTVTFTAYSGRRYRTSGHLEVTTTAAADLVIIYTTNGAGTQLQRSITVMPDLVGGVGYAHVNPYFVESGISGSTTRMLYAQRNVGTGTVNVQGSSTNPHFILVEDIGPA
jgi:hypothetical protein